MTTKKKVLIIENEDPERLALEEILEIAGFEVYGAGNAADARQLTQAHWDDLDVAVLDMHLDDPNEPDTTGADIAIEIRRERGSFPPESLVYSSKNEIDYYRLALRLGAAAYLLKESDDHSVVVQRVRVLALRRALNGENPKIAEKVARIAAHSRTKSEAMLTFCRNVLKVEFESCLGAPFVILLTEGESTQNCADSAGLPPGSSAFYHTLQALAHGKGNLAEPFILETKELGRAPDQQAALLYERLNGAAFLPLPLSSDLKLSIGILPQANSETPKESTPEESLCGVLAQYLRPTVLENIMTIWSQWTELRATRNSTAKLCLSVGQEIKDGLETSDLDQLEDLADDLNNTGQLLTRLEARNWQEESDPVSVREVVNAAWESIARSQTKPATHIHIHHDCSVLAHKNDLEIIFSRLLQWFGYRSKTTPPAVEAIIDIRCKPTNEAATIIFEDNSYRLPRKLREELFAPFTQAISTPFSDIGSPKSESSEAEGMSTRRPANTGRYLPLYLAKMLVEGRYHGLLEDHSDEIEERNYGHRIIMQFPPPSRMR